MTITLRAHVTCPYCGEHWNQDVELPHPYTPLVVAGCEACDSKFAVRVHIDVRAQSLRIEGEGYAPATEPGA